MLGRFTAGMMLLLLCVATATAAVADTRVYSLKRVYLGQIFLTRFHSDEPVEKVEMEWLGKTIVPAVNADGKGCDSLALLGTDVLFVKPGKKQLTVSYWKNGEKHVQKKEIQVYEIKRRVQRLKVAKKMVTPPQEVLDRIRNERTLVKKALHTNTAEQYWTFPFKRPVSGVMTSPYGTKRVYNGKPRSYHRGLDFAAPMGSSVRTVGSGKVVLVGDHYFAGGSVYIDHGMGVVSMYFHLSEPLVREGQFVEKGEVIGKSGKSGRVTGPHLHFGLSVLGQSVDPKPLFTKDFTVRKKK